jgi:Fe-S-cluster-containing dehydrogenase component
MKVDRRHVLKVLAAAGAGLAAQAVPATAGYESPPVPPRPMGMLYDTTKCIGCKACVVACREANELEPDRRGIEGGLYQAPEDLNGYTKNIIKLFKGEEQMSYFKNQCMHCLDPACASACMLHSLHKNEETGVVEYSPEYCVGCRYCQMVCPFNIPKFEFAKAVPKIVKCELCRHRIQDAAALSDGFTRYPRGQGPACCEVCPRGAVIYGTRDELLAEAKRRIAASPGRYFEDRVYGETEAGGTQVLYLSHVSFQDLGLPQLSAEPVPKLAYSVQEGIYKGLVAPVALYAALVGVMVKNRVGAARGGEGRA